MLIAFAVSVSCFAQSAPPQLIRDVRVFDGEAVHDHEDVLIQDGRISALGQHLPPILGEIIISGSGRMLLPGLIDAHVHIPKEATIALQQGIDLGVTTQLDMYSSPDKLLTLKALEKSDAPNLSDLRTAGMGATVPGGHPTPPGGGGLPTLSRPEEAQAFVDARIAEGSDYIKVILDDFSEFHRQIPTLDDQTVRAIVVAAHRRGRLVVSHVLTAKYAQEAIEAGVDGLAHMYEGEDFKGDFGAFAAQHHVFVIPTLSVI
jgi:imidazolonepropionase-like amidohydrolase